MTVNELYRSFLADLEQVYERPEAAHINSMIFESITGITRQGLIKDPNQKIDAEKISLLKDALSQLKLHKPVQYVTGEAWFYKMRLKVSSSVLIPRPETEELTEAIIAYLRDRPAAAILDIGTGSGCIAIAIKKNIPGVHVTAIDVSNEALAIAKENAAQQETSIDLMQLDFLDEKNWASIPSFDVIASNPPYIPEREKALLDKNVSAFEPHLALFVENNSPLIFYEKIAAFGKTHLKESGKIFLETHERFAEETAALFNDGHYSAEIKKDLHGKQRMVIATHRYR